MLAVPSNQLRHYRPWVLSTPQSGLHASTNNVLAQIAAQSAREKTLPTQTRCGSACFRREMSLPGFESGV